MPARRKQNYDETSVNGRSVLKLPKADAEAKLVHRIEEGRQLAETQIPGLEPGLVNPAHAVSDREVWAALRELRHSVDRWRRYNSTWLATNLGGEAAEDYKAVSDHRFGSAVDPRMEIRGLHQEIGTEISCLQSIHDRLEIWASEEGSAPISNAAPPEADAPIFIVHGSDTLRAESVARTVEQATGRQTIILREQGNLGQTLIEKFETHAAKAAYAIVVLTPDDEGGRNGEGTQRPRARQNVILEMGYFYGTLGRSRVSVLLYPGIEKPSDMDGIVYINFDDNGAWTTELLRELQHARIHVDISRPF